MGNITVMYVKLWVRNIVFLTIIFTIIHYVFSPKRGLLRAILGGVITGMGCSGIVSGIYLSRHIEAVSASPYVEVEDAFDVYHVRNVELRLPYEETFDLCIKLLDTIGTHKIREQNFATGKIVAMTYRDWWDNVFGTLILFHMKKIDAERTKLQIVTKPVLPTCIVDKGAALIHIKKITALLEEMGSSH